MLNWMLRGTICSLAFGEEILPGPAFYLVTYGLLGTLCAVAVAVPSIWGAMSLTGSTASVSCRAGGQPTRLLDPFRGWLRTACMSTLAVNMRAL
jgi:hypothetical protein